MKVQEISVGNTYYVQSKYDCKQCFKVKVLEVLGDNTVMVEGTTKSKKSSKKAPPFVLRVSSLHKTRKKAVGGYKQHHKTKK